MFSETVQLVQLCSSYLRPVRSEAETSFQPRKAFNTKTFSSLFFFNNSQYCAAQSMVSSSMVLKGSSQQWLPASVNIKRTSADVSLLAEYEGFGCHVSVGAPSFGFR